VKKSGGNRKVPAGFHPRQEVQPSVTSDGISLHYFDASSGAAILFIPVWTMAAHIFEPFPNSPGSFAVYAF
jgi:hypothetical protein